MHKLQFVPQAVEIGVVICQIWFCFIMATREASYKKSLLKRYPLFAGSVFCMTALVIVAVPFHFWASARKIAVYYEFIRLINLLILFIVGRGELFLNIYGPKMSLPNWAWKQAHLLMFLSFFTTCVITPASIYLLGKSESWIEISIKLVAGFLCIALISLAIYARKLGIAQRPSRDRMLAFGLIFYALAEYLYSLMPAAWQYGTFVVAAYGLTMLVWIAALILRRYEPQPRAHPDILKEFLELSSTFLKETAEFLEQEKMRQRPK